jgi:hypothetical protein
MIFYMQLRWNIEGRLKLEEVCDLERSEKARPPKTGANSSECTRWQDKGG